MKFYVTKIGHSPSILLCGATNTLEEWILLFVILYPITTLNFSTGAIESKASWEIPQIMVLMKGEGVICGHLNKAETNSFPLNIMRH